MSGTSLKDKILKFTLGVIMAVVTMLVFYPLIFILMTSFKDYADVIRNPFGITTFHPENYSTAWVMGKVQQYFMNSATVTTLAIIGQVMLVSISAFAIGRLRFKGAVAVSFILLSTMFVIGEMTTIPNYMTIRNFGLLNTLGALILPTAFGPPGLGVFMASSFVKKVPHEIEEAAIIDGCGIMKMFFTIDLPLMRPILSLVAILTFQGVWSDFFWPLITVIGNEKAKTLPLGLINFQSQYNSDYGVLTAGLVILTVPIILVYSLLSNYFVEGIAAGSVKG